MLDVQLQQERHQKWAQLINDRLLNKKLTTVSEMLWDASVMVAMLLCPATQQQHACGRGM